MAGKPCRGAACKGECIASCMRPVFVMDAFVCDKPLQDNVGPGGHEGGARGGAGEGQGRGGGKGMMDGVGEGWGERLRQVQARGRLKQMNAGVANL